MRRGSSTRQSIALTFDDGPSPGTVALVHYLREQNVQATFFVCGANVVRHQDIARGLLADGHEIGNHTFSHRRLCPRLGWTLNLLPPATVLEEFALAQQAIIEATGCAPRLLRPPYGMRWFGLAAALRRLDLQCVLWTVIGHDWEWNAEKIADHVLARAAAGGIVCLHDGRDTRPNPDVSATLAALQIIVPELKRRGYSFETVSSLLRPQEGRRSTN